MTLVAEVYQSTEKFSANEKFGLTSQIRRAMISIPSNIAEGCEREGRKDFANFLVIAKSSAAELETQISIAPILKYLEKEKADKLTEKVIEIKKMLAVLRKRILASY